MALITRNYTFTNGTVINANEVNDNENTLFNEINGNLTNANIKAGAGIVGSKLDLSTPGAIGGTTPSTGAFTTLSTTGNLTIGGSNKELRFYEGANYVGFEAPALAADQIWVLPTADGSANAILGTDGAGTLSWPIRKLVNVSSTFSAAMATNATTIPADDSPPLNNEGAEYMSLQYTPWSASNRLKITANVILSTTTADRVVAALFTNSNVNATCAVAAHQDAANVVQTIPLTWWMPATSTNVIRFALRAGGNVGTTTFNGVTGARILGGVGYSSMVVEEFVP